MNVGNKLYIILDMKNKIFLENIGEIYDFSLIYTLSYIIDF